MNGLKVQQVSDILQEIKPLGHEFSSEGWEHEYSFMYTREQEKESMEKTIKSFEEVLGDRPHGYLSCFSYSVLFHW